MDEQKLVKGKKYFLDPFKKIVGEFKSAEYNGRELVFENVIGEGYLRDTEGNVRFLSSSAYFYECVIL
jgi:hypothetical protein